MIAAPLPAVLAIARNLDVMPLGASELFGSLAGVVPNDGAWHTLAEPAGFPPLQLDLTYVAIVRFVRVEWSTVDVVVPPPLTLKMMLNGQSSIALETFAQLMLQAVARGTPAIEQRILGIVQPGARVSAQVQNTGTVSQYVDAFFTGWAYPMTLPDGSGYDRPSESQPGRFAGTFAGAL